MTKIVAFFSYTRADDAAAGSLLTQIREELEKQVSVALGEPVEIFQDSDDILLGQNWRKRLGEGLEHARYLIPVITPGFFNSEPCRAELARFLEKADRLERDDLVLPILFRQPQRLQGEGAESDDHLRRVIRDTQWIDWTKFRHQREINDELFEAVGDLAERIVERLHSEPAPALETANDTVASQFKNNLFVSVQKTRQEASPSLERKEPERHDIVDADVIPVQDEPMHLDAPPRAVKERQQTFLGGTIALAAIGLVVAVFLIRSLMPSLWNSINSSLTGDPYPDLSTFTDCAGCPEMIVIPGGTFTMGSPEDEAGRGSDEGPQREVTVGRFALAATEVTFAQWQACVEGGGCQSYQNPSDRGSGRGARPVINVSWGDAREYIAWLNTRVEGAPYRLPSEAEWEYAARAGTTTPFAFGETISTVQANYDGREAYGSAVVGEFRRETVPVGDLEAANDWGLRHMHGNAYEWVEDCWHESYEDAPPDGSPWRSEDGGDCTRRVVRGGSWDNSRGALRSANRFGFEHEFRHAFFGFRPARTLLTR